MTSNPPQAIELNTPACLPLGIVLAGGKPALLGITLQYPPIQMIARPNNELSVTGARAPIARAQALDWFAASNDNPTAKAELEIELGIPAYLGLGSDAMMGLTVGSALKHLTGLAGLDAQKSLESAAYTQGGLLVVDFDGEVLLRHELKQKEDDAWVFVIHMPQIPQGTPATLEADLRQGLLSAQPTSPVEPFWAAVEANDAQAAGKALSAIQTETQAALAARGKSQIIPTEANEVLDLLRTSRNIMALGQSFGGFGLWGLIHTATASTEARTRMRRAMSYEGGTTMASITNNTGVEIKPVSE